VALLDDLLDSWDRNNTILINLLKMVPDEAMDWTPMEGSPSIAQLFTHMNYCRLVFVEEDAPEFSQPVIGGQWAAEKNKARLEQMLNDSAAVVANAVRGRLQSAKPMDRHYDHPVLLFQHMIWHEGYHHGQIKLTLKMRGRPITDDHDGTWDIWMDKGRR
jgi:uncharacterized damage-inducible protein DinB